MKTSNFNICVLIFATILLTDTLLAQSTVIKLPTTVGQTSNLTISDSTNNTLMKLNADGGFCVVGNRTSGIIPATGSSARLMWYPRKSAFRVGYAAGTQWDDANVGEFSTAVCRSTIASGEYSMAMGYATTASGSSSTAMGQITIASGNYSTAMGYQTLASGIYSTAVGYQSTASSDYSVSIGYRSAASEMSSIAIGYADTASGESSTAIGRGNAASGYCSIALGFSNSASNGSTAIGFNTTASGQTSTAIGAHVSTNGRLGAFIIGDVGEILNPVMTYSSQDNQMTMRFSGGYRLYTNTLCTHGATLAADGDSWVVVSDERKKERFVKSDGEYFLNGLAQLKLGSWNYIDQNAKRIRHYGPMAQEIFRYFGKDSYGTIGNDTTLATADMDGIMMICLQALEKRTAELQKANEKIAEHENKIMILEKKIEELSGYITSSTTNNNSPAPSVQITNNK
jgi:hypothetical protein